MLKFIQIILVSIIILSFLGIVGEKKDLNLRNNLAGVCVVSIVALVVLMIL